MSMTKIRKRQIQLEGDDGLHSEYLRRTVDEETRYALTVASGKPAGTLGLDLTGHRIVNVAEAVQDTDAPNWGQVRNLVIQGEYRGEIVGYVVVRGSTTKYVQDVDGDGNNEETDAPAITGGLYLYLSAVNGRQPGDVAKWTGSSWLCDNSQGTFDTTSSAADPGGPLAGALYLLTVAAQLGDILPHHTPDTGEWTSDVYLKWNASYDVAGNQNIGRWEIWGSAVNIPFASKTAPGKVKIGDGLRIDGGVLYADPDTSRGLSWSGTSPNQQFGLNILDPFKFTSGALDIKRYGLDPADTGNVNAGAGDNLGLGYYGKVGFYLNSDGELVGQLRLHTLRLDYELGQLGHHSVWWLQNLALVAGGALNFKTSGRVTVHSNGQINFEQPIFYWYRGAKLQGGTVVVAQIPAGTTPALSAGEVLVWRFTPPTYNVGSPSSFPQSVVANSGSWVVLSSGIGSTHTAYESPTDLPVAVRQGNLIFFADGTVVPVPNSGSIQINLGYTHWDLIAGKPAQFEPAPHTHRLVETFYTNSGTRPDGFTVRYVLLGAGASPKGQRAVEELLRLIRRFKVEPQTYYRFIRGQTITIRRGLPSNATTPNFERQIRGVLIVFRAPHGGNNGYLLGNGTDLNSAVITFGGGTSSVIRTSGASNLGTVKLLTERGIEYTYDGFKAEYFDVGANTGGDGVSSDEEWHVALLYWDGSITWGVDEQVEIYPHGAGAPTSTIQPIDIARIALLTDTGDLVNLLEDEAKWGAVEEPVHAIRDAASDSVFSNTTTNWQAVDSGVTVTRDSDEQALKIVEPGSGTPTAGLAQLQDSGDPPRSVLQILPGKRYRLTFRAKSSVSNAQLKVQLVYGTNTVYWEQTITLGTSYNTFNFYVYTVPSGLRIRFACASDSYSGRQYWIDDIYLYQCGAYVDLRPDGITETYWYSSNQYVAAYAATPSEPAIVVHANARLVAANLERRTATDHVVVFSRNEDEPVQHLQKLSLSVLQQLLNVKQASGSVTGVNLTSGSYDIALTDVGAVLDPGNPRTSFNVYINGVRLTQDDSVNAYEIVTNASGQATAVRLNAAGIGYPILPEDRIDIVYWRA
jgi:hypothetical protein